jgi:hypothetical protein
LTDYNLASGGKLPVLLVARRLHMSQKKKRAMATNDKQPSHEVRRAPGEQSRESVPIDPAILEKVRQILKARGFSKYQNS